MKEYEAKKEILRLFYGDEGEYLSGEDISNKLGFSRAGVWKYISKLREAGYVIDAVPHLGYRLKSAPDKLYGYDISSGIRSGIFCQEPIFHIETTSSTNEKAYELAEKGAPEGAIVIAEGQTGGKGRMGRKWVSPKKGGVYMSVILRPKMDLDEIPSVTLIAGTAIIDAIEKACGIKAGMKWPNDIMIEGKKVCGVLTEIKAQPDMVDFLVLGIGVNVNTPEDKLPPEATSLKAHTDKDISRVAFVRELLFSLDKTYSLFKNKGFKALRSKCREKSVVLGSRVKIMEHNRSTEGLAEDIDDKGALILKSDSGKTQRIFSGDVTLCRPVKNTEGKKH